MDLPIISSLVGDDIEVVEAYEITVTPLQARYIKHLLVEAGNTNQHSGAGLFTETLFNLLSQLDLPELGD